MASNDRNISGMPGAANPFKPPLQERINAVDRLYTEAGGGKKAADVLSILDPLLEVRLGTLLDSFRLAPPELGALLDHRAAIGEVWRLRQELRKQVLAGQSAELALEAILESQMGVR